MLKVDDVVVYNNSRGDNDYKPGTILRVLEADEEAQMYQPADSVSIVRVGEIIDGKEYDVDWVFESELTYMYSDGSKYTEESNDDEKTLQIGDFIEVGDGVSFGKVGEDDMVYHPPHYTRGKVETIDGLESAVEGLTGKEAGLTWQVIKYMWRWKFKDNPLRDLKKAKFYLDRLIGYVEKGE